ncbi:MAG: 1-acylglycerol-3-phosphate O-acyltransferase [Bacteriovorax sp.]
MLKILRVIFTTLWVMFACILGILVGIFRPFNPKNVKVASDLVSFGRRFLGIQIDIRHREILDPARPCVFISNHQDNLDIFPGSFTLPDNTVTIGKRSIILIPFFGLFYWLSGNILINRKNKKSAFETMDVAANAIREKKISVWIMAEGTRSKGRGILPFKKGPFITAIKAQVPIVPIAISSYTKRLDLNKWKAGKILIEVLPPIQTTGLKIEDSSQIKDEAFQLISEAVKRLDLEIENEIKQS